MSKEETKNEVVIIKAADYGLEETAAVEMQQGLSVPIGERKLLIKEFEDISIQEVTYENVHIFKELRLKIVKNRTQGIDLWHRKGKEVSLRLGQYYDAVKRKENQVNKSMEDVLMKGENHFENIKKEELKNLQDERVKQLSKFVEDAHERDLAGMDEDVWKAFLSTKEDAYNEKIAAEKKAEDERIEDERILKLHNTRRELLIQSGVWGFREGWLDSECLGELSEEKFNEINDSLSGKKKSHEEEQDRIKKENERLKKEAKEKEQREEKERLDREKKESLRLAIEKKEREEREEKERIEKEKQEAILKKERDAKAKVESELKAKKEDEEKAEKERLDSIENDLKKGDKEKIDDLINDLELLKTKYEFKSKGNKSKYSSVGGLIDKVVNYIKE